MNPFLRQPSAFQRTPLRAERPDPKTVADGVATLRLYDPIDSWGGVWGVSAKEFVAALDQLPGDTTEIRLLINSPGGEVWEGLAILNALRSHPAKVTAVVEGIAASSASFIAAGVDELHVMQNAELFIHKAWGFCVGNAADMQKLAADLTHEDRNIASIYAGKAGGDVDDWMAAMAAETFYSAEEAVEAGLAERVISPPKGGDDATSKAKARFDLSVFNRGRGDAPNPKHLASAEPVQPDEPPPAADPQPDPPTNPDNTPTPPEPGGVPVIPPAAEPDPTEPKEERVSNDIRSLLGVPDDADDDAVKAAIEELKNQASKPDTPQPDPQRDAELAAASTAISELKDELARVSAQLADRNEREAAATKKALFDSAVKDGKIKPADRADWEARYDRAPDVTGEILAALAVGTAVPVAATGYTGSADTTDDLDAEWEREMARLDGPTATSKEA